MKSHRVRGADGDLPFVLTDIMGLQPKVLEGSQPEDIIKAIYGHVKDEYKVINHVAKKKKNVLFM